MVELALDDSTGLLAVFDGFVWAWLGLAGLNIVAVLLF